MPTRIATVQYQALAELRYQIRQFLSAGDAAALQAGLEPQQYQLLLAIRGLPNTMPATIRVLAERLALKHNSAGELVNRLEARGLVHRARTANDRRCVLIRLRPAGARLVEQVAQQRITELCGDGTALVSALNALIAPGTTRPQPKAKLKPLPKIAARKTATRKKEKKRTHHES
ncbi:MAG TPA: MarR family transcriptional regulator [Terriglobales bacterium]|nr:MarR family transcriptional regulator [Terriglobales bacterium]